MCSLQLLTWIGLYICCQVVMAVGFGLFFFFNSIYPSYYLNERVKGTKWQRQSKGKINFHAKIEVIIIRRYFLSWLSPGWMAVYSSQSWVKRVRSNGNLKLKDGGARKEKHHKEDKYYFWKVAEAFYKSGCGVQRDRALPVFSPRRGKYRDPPGFPWTTCRV